MTVTSSPRPAPPARPRLRRGGAARAAAVVGVAVLGVAGLSACSPERLVERAVENQLGVDIDSDEGGITVTGEDGSVVRADADGSMTFETEDGTAHFGVQDSLPDDFPADVPVLDLPVQYSSTTTQDGATAFQVALAGTGGKADFEEAVNRLTGAGYEVTSESVTEADGSVFASAELAGPWAVTVLVVGDASETIVTYGVAESR